MQLLSRHRLVSPYRALLAFLWAVPILTLLLFIASQGALRSLWRPHLWVMIAVMSIPVWHVWQQGLDLREEGLTVRIYVPRFVPYQRIESWHIKQHPQGRVLTIQDTDGELVLSFHAAHLSKLPLLLRTLDKRVPMHDYVRR